MMKALKFVITLLAVSNSILAQKVIKMEQDGGVYKIPCTVNGAKMKMIFDTGASIVSLSPSIAQYLMENDYVAKEDILGKSQVTVANGATANSIELILKDIEIGGMLLRNVKAVVVEGQNAPLLFGQTALSQLGSYTINGNNLILNNHSDSMSDEEYDILNNKIDNAMENGNYYAAIEGLKKIESACGLSSSGYMDLFISYYLSHQAQEAVETGNICLQYIDEYSENRLNSFYSYLGNAYITLKDFHNGIKYCELSLQYGKDYESKCFAHVDIGECYKELGDILHAQVNYEKAANDIIRHYGFDAIDLFVQKVDNNKLKELGLILWKLAYLRITDIDKNRFFYYATLGALCNQFGCIELCKEHNLDYKKTGKKIYESSIKRKDPNVKTLLFDE